MSRFVIGCVGAVAVDDLGRLLMIKRGHEPALGLWSIPGGRVEPGETDAGALAREMREETGLEVEVGALLGRVRRPGPGGTVLDIGDYAVRVTGGTLRAGDDAADARWVEPGELDALEITEGLVEALTGWGVLGLPLPWPPGPSGILDRAFAFQPDYARICVILACQLVLPVSGRAPEPRPGGPGDPAAHQPAGPGGRDGRRPSHAPCRAEEGLALRGRRRCRHPALQPGHPQPRHR